MRFLKKAALAVGLILLLALLKTGLARIWPSSLIFHYNLLSSLQLLLLLWALFTGLLESLAWKHIAARKAGWKSLGWFLAIAFFAELSCGFLLYHPRYIPRGALWSFRFYYNNYQRDILQYDPAMARYDTALFYRLKSDAQGIFRNNEFADSMITDSQGFRDGAGPAAGKPEVICLGDSYTLGWGVGQGETYARQLERMTGKKVLNTGMSSYGTARELESIRRLDKAAAGDFVLQYCYNDLEENAAYVKSGYRLPVSPRSVYDSACAHTRWSMRYFPGKYFCTLLKIFLKEKLGRSEEGSVGATDPAMAEGYDHYEENARLFLDLLQRSGLDFGKVRLLVFDIGEYERLNDGFAQALERQLAMGQNRDLFKGRVRVLHIASLLRPSDFYVLDGHIKASGHQKIAAAIASLLKGLP